MLWDGTHLYAISAIRQGGSSFDRTVRLYRFTYHAGSHSYSLDSELPVQVISPVNTSRRTRGDLEMTTLDKDSTGVLWATFTYANVPGSCGTAASCPAGPQRAVRPQRRRQRLGLVGAGGPARRARGGRSGDDISTIVHFGS